MCFGVYGRQVDLAEGYNVNHELYGARLLVDTGGDVLLENEIRRTAGR